MKIGDIVICKPETVGVTEHHNRKTYTPMKGKVIYIHPKGRFITVEFKLRFCSLRECFYAKRYAAKER